MAFPTIIEKLQKILSQSSYSEQDIVYLLSRIRKILEIDEKKEKYKVLNFYCNWALHAKIDDTGSIKEILLNLERDIKAHIDFVTHQPFKKELIKFIKEYSLSTKIFSDSVVLRNFSYILQKIYSDTPLFVKTDQGDVKFTLTDLGINNTYELWIDKNIK
jgi:hypothetical protein